MRLCGRRRFRIASETKTANSTITDIGTTRNRSGGAVMLTNPVGRLAAISAPTVPRLGRAVRQSLLGMPRPQEERPSEPEHDRGGDRDREA